ncbi:MAG: N-acetylmuramoyl-L-alanine amidase [Muribaculaceae bacterium]|nr:N-acetylmuramoyl-L-alanine amidase [Muribaculaceae bacterium]
MKKYLLTLLLVAGTVGSALALSASDVRIYINPGHGSWGPNDRPMATIPYPMLASTGRPDTCGFYESNTNLWKGFEMRDALMRMGVPAANITMSRTANGPYPYVSGASNETQYNKNLSVIAAEAEEGGYDMFVSIHSNAANSDAQLTNYPLYLYRGTNESEAVTGSKAMCQVSWPRHWMNALDPTSGSWSQTNTVIRGDVTFYGGGSNSTNSASGITYYGYLGVLKHGVPGFLVEGFFHTYQPARHRALNQDYCRQEGLRLARGAADYFGINGESVGYIMGSVKDAVYSLENSLYTYSPGTTDAHAPINGAVVKLYKGGTLIDTYTTDNNYNGIFVFKNLAPGNDYTISVTADDYDDLTGQGAYTVSANETTYMTLYMSGGEPIVDQKIKGIFAYDLNRATNDAGEYVFTFKSNANASEAYLVFTDSVSGDEVGRVTLNNIVEGDNTVTLAPEDLPGSDGQVLAWAVNVVGEAITTMQRVNNVNATYTRATVAIDRSPESAHFGTIYVGERVGKDNAGNGLYVCDVNGQPRNSTVYRGGQALSNCFRISVDGEGKVYIPDWADASSGIYIADPDNLGGAFTPFFEGTRASNGLITNDGVGVGSSTPSVWIQGTGADTKLYAYLEDLAGPSGNGNGVGVYNIGQSDGSLLTSWGQAPSNYLDIGALEASTNGNIIADPVGRGVWVAQNRSKGQNTAAVPSLVFADNSGNVLFNSGTDLTSLNGSPIAGFAINNANNLLVINDGDGVLQFYDITWNGNTPVLTANGTTFTADAQTGGKAIHQMAFDWGGNLVCAGKNIGIYSIPTADNQSTTPARTALSVVKKEIAVDTSFVKGIFAYELNSTEGENSSYTFTFKANSDAREAYLVFTDETTGEEVGRVALENVVEGSNTVTLTKDQLPGSNGQTMHWAVNVVGDAITRITRLNDVYGNYTRAMVAIDRSPESDHFATIYVGERKAGSDPANGIYSCDINGQPRNSTVYNGGITWANNMRLAVDGEGKIYIPEWGDATSGIYIADPDNLEGTYTQFFIGSRDASGLITNNGESVGSSVSGMWIQGTGADTKLYAYLEDVAGPSGKKNSVGIYNIGQPDGSLLTTWDQAPSTLLDVGGTMPNANGYIIADAAGRGTWVMEYRSKNQNLPANPSLIFVDNDGNIVFNSGRDLSSLNGSLISAFAINNENNMMVINDGDGVLQFYDITWNGNTPALNSNGTTYIADARTNVNAIYQMAFDWGGNLVCSGSNIGIYSIPTNDNQSTTPAKAALTVTKGTSFIVGDVNCDQRLSIADVTALIDYLLGNESEPFNPDAADVNHDNHTSIGDVTALIDLLLGN